MARTPVAWGPVRSGRPTSNSTRCSSSRLRKPPASTSLSRDVRASGAGAALSGYM